MKKALAIILLLTVLLLSACGRNTTQQASLPGIVTQGTEATEIRSTDPTMMPENTTEAANNSSSQPVTEPSETTGPTVPEEIVKPTTPTEPKEEIEKDPPPATQPTEETQPSTTEPETQPTEPQFTEPTNPPTQPTEPEEETTTPPAVEEAVCKHEWKCIHHDEEGHWRAGISLTHDLMVIRELLDQARQIDAARDNKLAELKRIIADKMNNPINGENHKVLIFTAFADTAEYLYENLYRYCRSLGLNTAVVTGSTQGKTSIEGFPGDFNTILTCFSPASKGRDAIYTSGIASTATIDVLIGTDCISEGQNLQDCDLCVNYDIHWNPIRIIQRYGRVDRIGSQNRYIQLVNFWPDASLDKYIDLKRRVESRMIAGFIVNPAEAKVLADENEVELAYRRSQLQKLKNETVDIEDISENISITDLGLNEFRLDLLNFEKVRGTLPKPQKGIYAVTYADRDYEPGVVFVLRNITAKSKVKSQNRMHPYYLVYISTSGKVIYNHLQPNAGVITREECEAQLSRKY